MKLSLPAKVSLFVTLIIVLISSVSTFIFTSAHSRSREKNRIMRGTALSHVLAKAAEEGLIKEDLDLIKKASYVIQAPEVVLIQVYSNIWEAVDAYPLDQLKQVPHPGVIDHFTKNATPVHFTHPEGYDFYNPILFKPFEEAPPVAIGYVRLLLSSATIKKELKQIIAANVLVAVIMTFFSIVSINLLVGRMVLRPVMRLHQSVSAFKNGVFPDGIEVPYAAYEVQELSQEFVRLSRTIRDKEERLIESERRISSLFERVEHGIFRLDRNGSVVQANNRFRDLFGPVNALCDIMIGDRNAAECLGRAERDNVLHLEDRAAGKSGEELTVSLSLYPDRGPDGALVGYDGYIIDITDKKRLQDRLIRAQKLEAVGTLAGGMAHDFNNLLTAILGYSGIILKATREGDPLHKPASIIHNAAKRGAEFGKKILTITRKEKIETRPVNLNEIVTGALELLQRSMPKNIEILTHLQEGLPITNADSAQLQQVIINLAVNARDAMPEGGRLVIETAAVGAADAGGADAAGFIRLSVSDTGVGISTETQARIFDPFFTTKDVGQGTGLGLYIVQSIISNHGGYINLYSEPSRGTRFNVYLPVTKGVVRPHDPVPADLRGSGTVLIIDDEADIRELCKDVLTPLGYTVLTAESGAGGINLYRERQETISLVILDMIMPKMGGSEVFSAIRTINPEARVLLYSGYSHKNFAGIDDLLKRGAVGFLQKPFSSRDIALAVKKGTSPESDMQTRG